MKTGLGLYNKYRKFISYVNLVRFSMRKYLLGFDIANLFLQRVDKVSLLLILKKNGAKIGVDCDIETGLIFHNCKNYTNPSIANNCHIGKNCFFDLRDQIIIKDNVVISMQCSFITHIDMTKSRLSEIYPTESKKIIVDNDSYLGSGSTVLMGVEIGKECLVASNSLVNNTIKFNSIVGGIPAKSLVNNKI